MRRAPWRHVVPLLVVLLQPVAAWTQQCPADPNILLIVSDDQGWPYHGFMQRYIQKRLDLGQLLPKTGTLRGWDDWEILLPDDQTSATAPLNSFLTPAIDSLAEGERGNYFPISHASASRCMPALASLMTGRYVRHLTLDPPLPATGGNPTDPILPELIPEHYLKMAGGKWQYLADLHRNYDNTPKRPFDRQIPNNDDWRSIIGKIDELKAFAGCAQCRKACDGGPTPRKACTLSSECGSGTCEVAAACLPGVPSAWENTTRLTSQHAACSANPVSAVRPFFMIFAPYVPHLSYDADLYCPTDGTGPFDRGATATQCASEPCPPENAYCNHSVYCKKTPPWTCQFVNNTILSIKGNLTTAQGKSFYTEGSGGNVKYLRFVNLLDRLIDELLVYLKSTPAAGCPGKMLFDTTVILFLTDNSAGPLDGSKSHFSEHGHRTPVVLHNPVDSPLPPLPLSPDPCAESPRCRPEFGAAVDILPTIRDFANCGVNYCLPLLPTMFYRGHTLRTPTFRTCSGSSAAFRQCVYDEQAGQQDLNAEDGTGVLAEAVDGTTIQLCKFFRCAGTQKNKLYDLRRDPYENDNLYSKTGFCPSLKVDLLNVHDGFWGVNGACPP